MTSPDDPYETAKDKATHAGYAAKNAASGTAEDLSEAADEASSVAGDLYGRAQATVADAVGSLPGSAGDAMAAGQRAYQAGSEQVAQRVVKQPLEALFLAGAIGFLVGWAANRT